ncbi:hypothetical protein BBUWI9123_E0026 (plasmid) [Borreliella burgdorferi WI91-23]|nr:hypothetical protein BBUWI9123_E0026 [Borreliella burgdorferi WI91-23]
MFLLGGYLGIVNFYTQSLKQILHFYTHILFYFLLAVSL